ncbi:MAG TPA: hypothetical protein VN688_01445 [Gemmataceae bacterium]|nr:hypothetical protein [Gemmataceae bacterium]
MFAFSRLLKLGYILGLAAVVVSLSQPKTAQAQRSRIAPMLQQVDMRMRQPMMMAQRMLMMGGMSGGMSGGMRGGMMGMGGMMMGGMGMGGMGMGGMGMGGFAGKGMGGFNGKKAL